MKRRTIVIYVLLFALVFLLTACSASQPVQALDQNEEFRLELVVADSKVKADEPIDCKAILTYVGEEESFQAYYMEEGIVMFALGGGEYFYGEMDLHTIQPGRGEKRVFYKDEPVEIPFYKRMLKNRYLKNEDEAAAAFWKEYLAEPELMLERGKYEIIAEFAYGDEPTGAGEYVSASVNITVR